VTTVPPTGPPAQYATSDTGTPDPAPVGVRTVPENRTVGIVDPVVVLEVAVMASVVPTSVTEVTPLIMEEPLPYQTEKL
jgi:hypothetical protein